MSYLKHKKTMCRQKENVCINENQCENKNKLENYQEREREREKREREREREREMRSSWLSETIKRSSWLSENVVFNDFFFVTGHICIVAVSETAMLN